MIISINSIPSNEITRSLVVGFGKKFTSYCSLKSLIPVEVLIAKQSEISEQLFKLTSTAYDPDVWVVNVALVSPEIGVKLSLQSTHWKDEPGVLDWTWSVVSLTATTTEFIVVIVKLREIILSHPTVLVNVCIAVLFDDV